MKDEEIVELIWNRSEDSVQELAKKYEKYCYYIAYGILHNHEDAQECVNDAYYQTWDSIPPHKPKKLSTYVGKITRNLALNKWEHYNAKKRGMGEVPLVLEELQECIPNKNDVEHVVDKIYLEDLFNDFLAKLPKEKRMLEILGDIEDSYIEEANPLRIRKRKSVKKMWWIAAAAACFCLLLTIGSGVSLYIREPYNATSINTEDAIASFPYGDTMVYVFQKEIEEEHEYAFEAVCEYKGVYCSVSTDTNNEEHIYEMLETILGESDNHVFSSILGFDNYYVKAVETWNGFVNWTYFVEINGVEIGIAEVFGYTVPRPEIYQKDFDGDGIAELVCNNMYGTGAGRVYIYRNNNGVVEVGSFCYDLTDEKLFPGITNFGSSYIQEVYHPENETFEISYPVEEGTKSVILQDIEWVEFVPYEIDHF